LLSQIESIRTELVQNTEVILGQLLETAVAVRDQVDTASRRIPPWNTWKLRYWSDSASSYYFVPTDKELVDGGFQIGIGAGCGIGVGLGWFRGFRALAFNWDDTYIGFGAGVMCGIGIGLPFKGRGTRVGSERITKEEEKLLLEQQQEKMDKDPKSDFENEQQLSPPPDSISKESHKDDTAISKSNVQQKPATKSNSVMQKVKIDPVEPKPLAKSEMNSPKPVLKSSVGQLRPSSTSDSSSPRTPNAVSKPAPKQLN